MKEPVVITEKEYGKGEHFFSEYADSIQWIPCHVDEIAVTRSIEASGARILVLGVERYSGSLYPALAGNAGAGPGLIARHGVGFDGINLDLCRKHNIFLTITPGSLDRSVAEHVMALLLSTARNIPALDNRMHNDRFNPKTGFELFNKILGIAGFGNIGKKVALIASKGFGMQVSAYDSLSLAEQAAKERLSSDAFLSNYGVHEYFTDFDSFIKKVNILTIHLPVNQSTRYYFNSERLGKMNPDSILINTGRGALVDEKALYTALSSRRLKAAAIDVFNHEPYEPVSPEYDLRKLPNIILTPHVASDTFEANESMQRKVVDNIHLFLEDKHEEMTRVV
ncbi:MAG TPA: hypothetical protein ENI06_02225 [Spirochaetales bacterium]|nr:hypothetical protein [Spirochaetales bacterium]